MESGSRCEEEKQRLEHLSTSQGCRGLWKLEKAGSDFPLEHQEGAQPWGYLDCSPAGPEADV